MTIPEAAYAQLRHRPPEDEQGYARNMQRSLINVLYVNKQEFCASGWRSNQGYTMMHGQPIIKTMWSGDEANFPHFSCAVKVETA